MNRRGFLLGGAGVMGVAFYARSALPVIPKRPEVTSDVAMGWVRINDGQYSLYLPRVEMGQNITAALKQIACDELMINWSDLTVHRAATSEIDRVAPTVGSNSIKDFALPIAQACATLRDAVANGGAEQTKALSVNDRPVSQLRSFSNQKYVGKRVAIDEFEKIVRGQSLYAADIRRPNMIFGRVLRAQVSLELKSTPTDWNEAKARDVTGFIALVVDPLLIEANSVGLGILASTPGALDRIEKALDVQWKVQGSFDQQSIDDELNINRRLNNGDLQHNLQNDAMPDNIAWDVDLQIEVSAAAHGAIEPRAAVAEFDANGSLSVWAGNQDLYYAQDTLAKSLKLDVDAITVHSMRIGGGFGGKTICAVELEAALLARSAGKPVKVQWTREQELNCSFYRPPSSHRVRVEVSDGKINRWWHSFCTSYVIATIPHWLQRVAIFIGEPAASRSADMPYLATHRRIEFDQVPLPIRTGAWRGLGAGPNSLAIESAIDECARIVNEDPIDFRLRNLKNKRLRHVLEAIARLRDSSADSVQSKQHSDVREGWGIASGVYKNDSYAAVAAFIVVDPAGVPTVKRLICAHDCGIVINPDQTRAQCEGNLVWGLGMVFTDRLPVDGSRVTAKNFDAAPIPRLPSVPDMSVELIESKAAPSGAGETAIVAAAAAIANAIREATGVRVTKFPLDNRLLVRGS